MKFEYLYVVFFILSLVYKWYKGKNKEASPDEVVEESPSNYRPEGNSTTDAFESLIAQFENVYSTTQEISEEPEIKEVDMLDEPLEKQAPKIIPSTPVESMKSSFHSRPVVETESTVLEESDEEFDLDVEKMIVYNAILNRPYK